MQNNAVSSRGTLLFCDALVCQGGFGDPRHALFAHLLACGSPFLGDSLIFYGSAALLLKTSMAFLSFKNDSMAGPL